MLRRQRAARDQTREYNAMLGVYKAQLGAD